MFIGLTYDLRQDYLDAGYGEEETAEFDRPDTIDAIENTLRLLGHETDRIGRVTSLVERLARGDRWDLVFNIAEGLHGIGREAQVPALLDAYEIPYTFSDPAVVSICLHKAFTKSVMSQAGIPTAPWVIVQDLLDVTNAPWAFPMFVKPVAEGSGKGISSRSRVEDHTSLASECSRLLAEHQSLIVEPYLPGEEFTVGVIGTGKDAAAIGVMQVEFMSPAAAFYSYSTKRDYESLVRYSLRRDALGRQLEELAVGAWVALGCRDAGRIDFRCDAEGHPQFLEVNPLAGLNPTHSDLPILCGLAKIAYSDLIRMILESAMYRCRGLILNPNR